MQTVSNRVAALLGIEYPIVQAPMNFIAGHALAGRILGERIPLTCF